MTRAIIYARFSTDMQRDASIDDQVRVCRALAQREGLDVINVYSDAAISGATDQRPGFQGLLAEIRQRRCDVVLAESLDRFSRDQEHLFRLFKEANFAEIQIITQSEGVINELNAGLKGIMGSIYLKDLAEKTHRGLEGRVLAGRSAGGRAYGYRTVRPSIGSGQLETGLQQIDEIEAAVVRRIFGMYADGHSPIAIAHTLNAEGIKGPQGRAWQDTTIRGDAKRDAGILRNRQYIGIRRWNKSKTFKNPETGKRAYRRRPEDQLVDVHVEELRIVDRALWDRVQARLAATHAKFGAGQPRFWDQRRARHLVTGKVWCGCCGGALTAAGKDYLTCRSANKQGRCPNRRSIRRPQLEGQIVAALQQQMMAPDLVQQFIADVTAEWDRQTADAASSRTVLQRELVSVQVKLNNVIDAIEEGMATGSVKGRLSELEARKATLEAQLSVAAAAKPSLDADLAEVYRARVANLQNSLADPAMGTAALDAIRALIERITVIPEGGDGDGVEIELTGDLAAMLALASGPDEGANNANRHGSAAADHGLFLRSVKMVAGIGFEPMTFRL